MGGAVAREPVRRRPGKGAPAALALCGLGAPDAAWASPELAQQHGCLACHAVDVTLSDTETRELARWILSLAR